MPVQGDTKVVGDLINEIEAKVHGRPTASTRTFDELFHALRVALGLSTP